MNPTVELTAQVGRLVRAPAATVWTGLTTRANWRQFFFGVDVLTTWKVGSSIRMRGEHRGQAYEDLGEILVFERCRHLSFSRWSGVASRPDTPADRHVVTFDLEPDGAATQVTLSQSSPNGAVTHSDIEHRAEYERNWTAVLNGLARMLP